MPKALLSYFIIILITTTSIAQNLYLQLHTNELYELNQDAELTLVSDLELQMGDRFGDIALSSSHIFYGIANQRIYEINTQDGTANSLILLPGHMGGANLTCYGKNDIYFLDAFDDNLVKYNIPTGSLDIIAHIGYPTPGDLTFYKGNIIFPSFDEETDATFLMAYNLQSQELDIIYCLDGIWSYGISNLYPSCDNNSVIVSGLDGVYEVDLENQTRTKLDIDLDDKVVFGLASDAEHMVTTCNFQFSSIVCQPVSSLNAAGLNHSLHVFPNPFVDKILFKGDIKITSIEIFDLNGRKISHITDPELELDLKYLASGIYFLKLTSQDDFTIKKIVKE